MKILVTGASGFVGSQVVRQLAAQGDEILRLVRRKPAGPQEIRWDPQADQLDPAALEGVSAVVHLAGEPIAAGRWTPAKKARIRESRIQGTRLLAETLGSLSRPPQVLLSASAIGIYGCRGAEPLTEKSRPGKGFLAEVGVEWERATEPALKKGIRVVLLRIGIVLHPAGGALKKMLPAFRLGLGGPLGSGRQYMSWISREDLVGIIQHALVTPGLTGPVNAVSPRPVTNLEFTRALGKALHRPAFLPVPAVALKLLLGKLADEALLASARVEPAQLKASGFRFKHPDLETALRAMLWPPRRAL